MSKRPLVLMIVASMALAACTNPTPVNPVDDVINRHQLATAVNPVTPVTGCAAYPASVALAVPNIGEFATQWCWAASGEMCMEYLNNNGVKLSQCDMANNNFCPHCPPSSNCISGGDPSCDQFFYPSLSPCNQPAWPDLCDYGYKAQSTMSLINQPGCVPSDGTNSGALSYDELLHQISCLSKPVIFTWVWTIGNSTDEQAHLMVATGYEMNDSLEGRWLFVNDPGGVYNIVPYSFYVAGNNHTHYADFYNISRSAE